MNPLDQWIWGLSEIEAKRIITRFMRDDPEKVKLFYESMVKTVSQWQN